MEGSLWYCTWFGLNATRPPFLKCQFMLLSCDSAIQEAKKPCISWHRAMLVLQGAARREGLHQRWTMAKTGRESRGCSCWNVHCMPKNSFIEACFWGVILPYFSDMHGSYHLGCSGNAMGRCVVSRRDFNCRKFQTRSSPWPFGNSKAPAFRHCIFVDTN